MLTKDTLDNRADQIWKSAIKLRGKFKAYEYQNVVLPIITLRRIECVLEEMRATTKEELLASKDFKHLKVTDQDTEKERDKKVTELNKLAKEIETEQYPFYNTTNFTIAKVLNQGASQTEKNFRTYVNSFSKNIDEIFSNFDFAATIGQLDKNDRLVSILEQYKNEALSPSDVSNIEMGYVYEELLRKFSEQSGEEAGEHFTPREVIRLMVELLDIGLNPKDKHKAIQIYDPACGTGGMLSVAKEHLLDAAKTDKEKELTGKVVELFGQELSPKNYAICKADMIIKGENAERITQGNSLTPDEKHEKERGDQHAGRTFDYMLSNPPFGVNWKEYANKVYKLGDNRYYNNYPSSSDGAFLFLMTMIEKMKEVKDGGSKIAIIFNGSPLSNGDALSGESEIRKYILEKDLLDCIVMLPDQLFYNTSIYTYIWLLTNKKPPEKKGKVLIINAREQFSDEPKSFGQKRHRMEDKHRVWIEQKHQAWKADEYCKIFNCHDFVFYKCKVVFWQTDENDKPAYLTEPYTAKLNDKTVKDKVNFFGGEADFKVILSNVDNKQGEYSFTFKNTFKHAFETQLWKEIEKTAYHLVKDIDKRDFAKWLAALTNDQIQVEYTHRDYRTDNEYVPHGQDLGPFLKKEIGKPIISFEASPPIGYEILPNKYFFIYRAPEKAKDLLQAFWDLEEKAQDIIKQLETV